MYVIYIYSKIYVVNVKAIYNLEWREKKSKTTYNLNNLKWRESYVLGKEDTEA